MILQLLLPELQIRTALHRVLGPLSRIIFVESVALCLILELLHLPLQALNLQACKV